MLVSHKTGFYGGKLFTSFPKLQQEFVLNEDGPSSQMVFIKRVLVSTTTLISFPWKLSLNVEWNFSCAYSALLFLVILAGHHSCSATNNCAPSSCGNITNISPPFRLQTDPKSCGRKEYELGCENNRTTVYFQRVKYYVQAIDYYPDFTIRLVEADFQKDDCLSIPRHSLQPGPFVDDVTYYPFRSTGSSFSLTFLSCPKPIPSPPFNFVNTSSCKNGSIYSPSFRHMEGYSYVMVSYLWMVGEIAEVPDLCRIHLIYDLPSYFRQLVNINNMSLIEVQDILAYGFELSWAQAACDYVKENFDNATIRNYQCPPSTLLSLSPPQITSSECTRKPQLDLSDYEGNKLHTKTIYSDFLSILIVLLITLLALLVLIVIYHTLLFLCGIPCLITLLVYIWRRRHLSIINMVDPPSLRDASNECSIDSSYQFGR
ncbi:hypothetical protein SADUNF_Sadunf07G0121800 [Salix dunnii]|uniref:Wall-associated receptor kinase galacturonan-binding domain-containing protein n=1 Tax=Salix dunnii TaxID=1413687 RepID=A0A835K0K6_9ROSI|nr:hypothetical protein SADUNF_Sadunf07G0121800 [Salix dunnii]